MTIEQAYKEALDMCRSVDKSARLGAGVQRIAAADWKGLFQTERDPAKWDVLRYVETNLLGKDYFLLKKLSTDSYFADCQDRQYRGCYPACVNKVCAGMVLFFLQIGNAQEDGFPEAS